MTGVIGSRRSTWIVLAGLLLFGAYLRLNGLDWDQGHHLHPDERFLTMVATNLRAPASIGDYFDTARSPLNPANAGFDFFVYGTLPLFLVRATAALVGWTDYGHIHLIGRAWSATFDLITIVLLFALGRRLADARTGLAAAALFTACTTAIQQAHYFTVDSAATCFATAALLPLVSIALGGSWRAHLAFGLCFGLALACRANLLLLAGVYPLAVAAGWRTRRLPLMRLAVSVAAAVAATTLVFRTLQPYAFDGAGFVSLRFAAGFLDSFRQVRGYTNGTVDFPPSVQWIGRVPIVFPAKNLLLWGLGPAWGLAVLASIAWLGRRALDLRRLDLRTRGPRVLLEAIAPRTVAAAIVLLWGLLLFTFQAVQFAATLRYFLPVTPLLALLVALVSIGTGPRAPLRYWGFAAVLVGTAVWALAFSAVYARPHTRVAASAWIYDHVAPGETIANEHWDDGLPLGLAGRSPQIYRQFQLALYDDENDQKRRQLIEQLASADVIAISSNRLYGSIPRAPWRYPLARRYYELLFAGELGFRLERVFTSYPTFAGVDVPDDSAEEGFTVHDHPKVLIFRKTAAFDPARVAALLGAVPLDNIVRVSPREASRLYREARPPDLVVPDEQARRAAPGPRVLTSAEAVLRWALVFEVLSLACFALIAGRIPVARDAGYGFSKLLAWLVPGTIVWLLASTGLAPYGAVTARVVAASIAAAGLVRGWHRRRWFVRAWPVLGRRVATVEVLSASVFAAFLVVRAVNPAVFWGEKPMDFAILNALLRAVSLPPADPWFAGATLNYFYFGHHITAVFAQVSGVPAAFAFNLAIPTIAATLATTACIAAWQWTARLHAGLAAAGLVVLAGNLAGIRAWLTGNVDRLGFDYFWSSSRVVAGTINEFPFWNLVFADLHAHVLAMPLQVGLLYVGALWTTGARRGRAAVLLPLWSAWLAGAVAVTSSWSAPVALGLQGAFILSPWLAHPRDHQRLARAALTIAVVGLGAVLLYWPFWAHYTAPPRNIGLLVGAAAPLADVLTVFGIPAILVLVPLGALLLRWAATAPRAAAAWGVGTIVAAAAAATRSPACAFFAAWVSVGLLGWLVASARGARAAAVLVATCGALGVATETIYLWDRMNTVFKFYLDMWLMLSVAAAVLAVPFVRASRPSWRPAWRAAAAALVACGLFTSVTGLVGFVREPKARTPGLTLDGLAYLGDASPSEQEALAWMNREVQGVPVVLEAQGPFYQRFSRVSMNTGLPTVLGWEYHLYQQGRPEPQLKARAADVRDIFESENLALAERLLRQYHVDLVYIGPLERETYRASGLAKFARSTYLRPIFRNRDVVVYGTATPSVSVKTWLDPIPPHVLSVPLSMPLREPRGIAAAPDGTIVVADFGNRRVQRVDSDLRPVSTFGHEGSAPGEFRDPCGVVVAPDGSIFVADTWNHRIQHLSAEGEPLEAWQAGMFGPRGIALAPDGSIYVADTGRHRILRFARDGASTVVVPPGTLDSPVGLAFDLAGRLVVTDTGHHRVVVFGVDGARLHEWPVDGWAAGPRLEPGLAVGPDGTVWVTDPTGGRVMLFDPQGRPLGEVATRPTVDTPLGITVVDAETAFVTDGGRHAVVRITRGATAGTRTDARAASASAVAGARP